MLRGGISYIARVAEADYPSFRPQAVVDIPALSPFPGGPVAEVSSDLTPSTSILRGRRGRRQERHPRCPGTWESPSEGARRADYLVLLCHKTSARLRLMTARRTGTVAQQGAGEALVQRRDRGGDLAFSPHRERPAA